uniref:Uncharacterized protein n=1 Tax=Ananas comosus var. bracteatus TaxID=296719 RepID=A0A6V7QRS4_ANACO
MDPFSLPFLLQTLTHNHSPLRGTFLFETRVSQLKFQSLKFFNCLRGGYYSPHVTQMREALTFLQRQGYFYCLKSYHEDLVKKFVEMNKLWSNCLPSTSIDERIQIWNKRMNQKPTALVDLNAVPIEEDVSNFLLSKRTKDMDGVVCAHNSVASFNGTAVSASNRAKGLLKRKPIETGSWKNQFCSL